MRAIYGESSLVRGFKSQEPEALRNVLEYTLAAARRWSRVYGMSPDDADDIVQETILSLLRRTSESGLPISIQSDEQLKHFLFATLRNRLVERYRSFPRRSEANPDLLDIDDLREAPDTRLSTVQQHQQVQKALAQLSTPEREIIMLRYVEEMSIDEIAKMLGISASSARVRIHRSLHLLRKLMTGGVKP